LLLLQEKQEEAEKTAGAPEARLTTRATSLQPTATPQKENEKITTQDKEAINDKRRHKNLISLPTLPSLRLSGGYWLLLSFGPRV
jgi:hypothetical protein